MNNTIPSLRWPSNINPDVGKTILYVGASIILWYLSGNFITKGSPDQIASTTLWAIPVVLVLGALHSWAITTLPPWNERPGILLKLLLTLGIGLVGAVCWALILAGRDAGNHYDFLPKLAFFWFIMPFTAWSAWDIWMRIPPPQYKTWSAVAEPAFPILFEEGGIGITVVAYGKFIPLQKIGIRMAMPLQQIGVGLFFHAFARYHNMRSGAPAPIPLTLADNRHARWQFYQKRFWGRRYIDPDRTFGENKVHFRHRFLPTSAGGRARIFHAVIYAELID